MVVYNIDLFKTEELIIKELKITVDTERVIIPKTGCIWNYHGSKLRYLEEILSVVPNSLISTKLNVLDLFTGGSSVATSLPIEWEVTANDQEKLVVSFSESLQEMLHTWDTEYLEKVINSFCTEWVKDNKDKSGYNKLKNKFNTDYEKRSIFLYALTMSSISNMIRFNKKGEQNLQFGNRCYNKNSRSKMLHYLNKLNERVITFKCKDFREYKVEDNFDLWIIDPPYRTSLATYSEKGQWGLKEDVALLNTCNKLNAIGKKFIYFNQTITQGKENTVVSSWKNKYNCVQLKDTTTNCSAQRKNKGRTTEVMIHNF